MLSFQLKREIEVILTAYDEAAEFRDGIRIINESFPGLSDLLAKIGESGGKGADAGNKMRTHLAQLRNKVQPISPRSFFSSMEEFQRQLQKSTELKIDDLGLIDQISSRIETFSDHYEEYIKTYTAQSAGPLIVEARSLSEMLDGFQLALRLAHRNLDDQEQASVSERELTIYLPEMMPLDDFAQRLLAIHRLYEVIAQIIGVDVSEAPLRLQKAESGSLWSKVFGDSRVIGLIVDFLRSSVTYLYRSYTKEGRISAIPQKLDSLDKVMNFSERLRAEGIDTSEINELLRTSAVGIAKDINSLLGDQREITINGETQSLANEVQNSLEYSGRRLNLEYDLPDDKPQYDDPED
ncbi:hypothetical protein [uncultured Methylophaga sp.]|uniref:hypothetical protein n=1 Tax=uncultured Methylophaga sp. TaxID=285271 RepID=UPI00263775CA|nr:hypothetical protein [uncultured Methylophaga sp.]